MEGKGSGFRLRLPDSSTVASARKNVRVVPGLLVKHASHQAPRADLPSAVTALTCQVVAVSQEARGPSALQR